MCKKKIVRLALTACLVMGLTSMAYAAQDEKAAPAVDPALTNMISPYPAQAEVLPKIPPVPSSIKNTEEITRYVAAVEAYMALAQKYIDASTNDLNKIINERNLAIENANKIIEEYNAFFEKHQAKKK